MFNSQKLEQLLVANWASFMDYRKLLTLAKQYAATYLNINANVEKLSITRFEIAEHGFIIWIDFSIASKKATTEILVSNLGEITHVQTIEN